VQFAKGQNPLHKFPVASPQQVGDFPVATRVSFYKYTKLVHLV